MAVLKKAKPTSNDVLQKITNIMELVNKRVIGMPEVVRGVFLAMLSGPTAKFGEHLFMIGLPGVGKSYVMDVIASCIDMNDAEMFDYLFHPFSTVDELTGPTDLDAMFPADKNTPRTHRKVIDNFLPTARLAILDEIWKSGPASTSLFKIMNERKFRNGKDMVECKLISALTASNEYPVNKMDAPLWDRLLFRFLVEPVWDYEGQKMIQAGHRMAWAPDKITIPEIYTAKKAVQEVVVPEVVERALFDVHLALCKKDIRLSNRRRNAMYNVVRANAYLCGREEATVEDVAAVWPCCWEHDSQIKSVRQLIIKITNRGLDKAMTLADVVEALYQQAAPMISAFQASNEIKALAGVDIDIEAIEEKMANAIDDIHDIINKSDSATRAEAEVFLSRAKAQYRDVLPYATTYASNKN